MGRGSWRRVGSQPACRAQDRMSGTGEARESHSPGCRPAPTRDVAQRTQKPALLQPHCMPAGLLCGNTDPLSLWRAFGEVWVQGTGKGRDTRRTASTEQAEPLARLTWILTPRLGYLPVTQYNTSGFQHKVYKAWWRQEMSSRQNQSWIWDRGWNRHMKNLRELWLICEGL